MDIVALFYDLDKFVVDFEPQFNRPRLEDGKWRRHRRGQMYLSEIMTILVLFHSSNYRTFKHFYLGHVRRHLRREFPHLLSYSRFVEQIPRALGTPECLLHSGQRQRPDAVPKLTQKLFGKLVGDKGYISQIEHSRHRSVINYFTEIIAGLIAYTYRDKLPSLNLRPAHLASINGVAM